MGIKELWRGFRSLPEDIKARISNLIPLFERGGVLLAYLFGSLAKGNKGEDVDLALLPGRDNFAELREEIEERLDTFRVHLVNLKSASLVLKFGIISTGILIYKRDEVIENEFELSVIRQYQDYEPIRRKQWEIFKERLKARWF